VVVEPPHISGVGAVGAGVGGVGAGVGNGVGAGVGAIQLHQYVTVFRYRRRRTLYVADWRVCVMFAHMQSECAVRYLLVLLPHVAGVGAGVGGGGGVGGVGEGVGYMVGNAVGFLVGAGVGGVGAGVGNGVGAGVGGPHQYLVFIAARRRRRELVAARYWMHCPL
jgi:hypothetical protein